MHVRIARGVHKVGRVIMVDINADRLAISADAVAPDVTIDASSVDPVAEVLRLTDGRGADVVITATPANVNQEQAIAMAAGRGADRLRCVNLWRGGPRCGRRSPWCGTAPRRGRRCRR